MNNPVKLVGMVPTSIKVRQQRIHIDSLEVMADIGFHDYEVGAPQRLLVSVDLWVDELAPPAGDDPALAWDYDIIVQQVRSLATERRIVTTLADLGEATAGLEGPALLVIGEVAAMALALEPTALVPEQSGERGIA